jgi:hypothetical protein
MVASLGSPTGRSNEHFEGGEHDNKEETEKDERGTEDMMREERNKIILKPIGY